MACKNGVCSRKNKGKSMPTPTDFPLGLQQQQFNQPLQAQQPQFGNIGLQGGGNPPPQPPQDNRTWMGKGWDWLTRQRGIQDLPLTWNDTGPVSTSAGKTGQGGGFGFGSPGGYEQLPNYTPEQIQALNGILGGGLQSLMNPYEGWQGIEDYAHQQFNERIVPNILERINAGNGARLSSPSLSHQLSSGGSGLASMLAAQKAQYGQQNRQIGLQQAQLGLSPQFQYASTSPQPGLVQTLGPTAAQAALMYYTGGLSGAPALAHTIGQFTGKGYNPTNNLGK